MARMTMREARRDFAAAVAKAGGGERVALVRHGKTVAALVSVEELEFLDLVEDRVRKRTTRPARAPSEGVTDHAR